MCVCHFHTLTLNVCVCVMGKNAYDEINLILGSASEGCRGRKGWRKVHAPLRQPKRPPGQGDSTGRKRFGAHYTGCRIEGTAHNLLGLEGMLSHGA